MWEILSRLFFFILPSYVQSAPSSTFNVSSIPSDPHSPYRSTTLPILPFVQLFLPRPNYFILPSFLRYLPTIGWYTCSLRSTPTPAKSRTLGIPIPGVYINQLLNESQSCTCCPSYSHNSIFRFQRRQISSTPPEIHVTSYQPRKDHIYSRAFDHHRDSFCSISLDYDSGRSTCNIRATIFTHRQPNRPSFDFIVININAKIHSHP
jgi:hypothetical protein